MKTGSDFSKARFRATAVGGALRPLCTRGKPRGAGRGAHSQGEAGVHRGDGGVLLPHCGYWLDDGVDTTHNSSHPCTWASGRKADTVAGCCWHSSTEK